jgi:hypothetical protein
VATSPLDPLKAGFSALITPPGPTDANQLFVSEYALFKEDGETGIP